MTSTAQDQDIPGQGMETLSALFDGELEGDAARFAIKRLGHDARWRQAVGNWQLAGDALRGQRPLPAPGDFAARVAAAVASQPALALAAGLDANDARDASQAASPQKGGSIVKPAQAPVRRRRWMGGAALAASVAMVAMLATFITRPFSQDASDRTSPADVALLPASIPAGSPVADVPTVAAPLIDSPRVDAPVATGPARNVGAVAVADVPRRASARGNSGQSARAGLRARSRQAPTPAVASARSGVALASSDALHRSDANPFDPATQAGARPWPRAVLPDATSAGGFTASYGGTSVSPSFYPFEPRLPNSTGAAPDTSDGIPPGR